MLQFDTDSTISAIATGEAPALRGAVRITGPDTVTILAQLCSDVPELRRATRWETQIQVPVLGGIPVAVFCWPDSRSYTGQPSAEIHALGSPILLQQIQSRVLASGAKLAQPGEFTLRAFLAGRLDLTQCEAVLGVIHANNQKSLQVALHQLSGGLAAPLHDTRQDLIHLLADIEAGLDFVDEDISFISTSQILDRLALARDQIEKLLEQMHSRSAQSVAYQIALVGEPNAGKSSLLNALANASVAIVSPIAGTTRDFLRKRMEIEGVTLDLLDTAGLEEWDDDSPRGIAQAFTREQIEQADLVLRCCPSGGLDDPMAVELGGHFNGSYTDHLAGKPIWNIRTKSDLCDQGSPPADFSVSAVSGEGIEALRDAIVRWVRSEQESQADAVPMTVERCRGSLANALIAVDAAAESAREGRGDEITAGELRIALDEIGLVTGTIYNDDILDALFSRFCIGK